VLDNTLDKLAESLTVESRINAVQDARIESHTKRLDAHDTDISELRRNK
jgi:hypothetical protein